MDINKLLKDGGLGDIMKQMGVSPQVFTKSNESSHQTFPKYYLVDKDDLYLYNFELPGYEKKDISLIKKGNTLVLSGTRVIDIEGGNMLKNECDSLSDFRREIVLEKDCDLIESALFKDGILTIALCKVKDGEAVIIE